MDIWRIEITHTGNVRDEKSSCEVSIEYQAVKLNIGEQLTLHSFLRWKALQVYSFNLYNWMDLIANM